MAKEIVIKVDHTLKGDTDVTQETIEIQDAQESTEKTKRKADKGASRTIAAFMGKQALNYAVSNYGNLTGDYIAQANIQGVIEIGGIIAMAFTGPVGVVASIGAVGVKVVSQQIDLYKKNLNTQLLRERTGMNNFSGGRL